MVSARQKGALLSYILMAAEIFSSLFFTPFLIRSFGQAEYGVYSLVNSVTSYLYLFDLGVGNAVIRYMAKYRTNRDEKKQSEFLSAALIFYTFISIAVITVGFLLQSRLATVFGIGLSNEEINRAKIMFMITMLNAAVTFVFTPFHKTILAFERFGFSKSMDIVRLVLRVSISFLILFLGGRGIAIVSVNLILTILFSLVMAIYLFTVIQIKPSFGKLDRDFMKEVTVYSGIIFLQTIATQINKMADQFIMGIMIASSSVIIGVYAIGAQITSYFESFAMGINGILMPGVVRLIETKPKPKTIENEMVRIGRMIFMLLSAIYLIFLFFGHDFVCLWTGDENEHAYYVAAIIMLPMLFHLTQSVGTYILWAMNKHQVQAVLQLLTAVFNIGFTIVLIRWNPLFGATIATAVAYFIGDIVVKNIVFTKYIGISMRSYYKGLLKGIWFCLLLSALAGGAMYLLELQGWFGLIINCAVILAVYVVSMYIWGMNEQEKKLILGILERIKVFFFKENMG